MTDKFKADYERLAYGTRGFLYPKKLADEDIEKFKQILREKYTKPSVWSRLRGWLGL